MRRSSLLLAVVPAIGLCPQDGRAQDIPMSVNVARIDPPESGFFSKRLVYEGIPIKAHVEVADEALVEARRRLAMMLGRAPGIAANLATDGAELHVIGKAQATSDLPEYRHLKGKPFDGDLDVDQRTRGLGGLLASCGEENLLRLPGDRYAGRDICVHEFAHTILAFGLPDEVRRRITEQFRRSSERGLWKSAYAASNDDEFFAELSMWYFGTRGDLGKIAPKPKPGRRWLEQYDPEAFRLLDDLYSGRIEVPRRQLSTLEPLPPRGQSLKSLSGKIPTSLMLVNKTPDEVRVYWLDYEGKRQRYGTIPAGGRHSWTTFATHAWLLTSKTGKGMAVFVARETAGIGVLEKPASGRAQP